MATESFDVVVVGAGGAGCVAAARLSESGFRSVLLLEAGPDMRSAPTPEMRDGWGFPKDHHWGLQSEPDRNGLASPLRRCKLVGGTSWVTRFAVRGSPADFDEWAELGNLGWGFDECLPYFKKIESDLDFGHQPWHGNSGPIPVNRYRDLSSSATLSAANEAMGAVGFPLIEDHNEPGAVGVGKMPMSSRDGWRVSAADAYLPLATMPSNLRIQPDTQVSRVGFEGTTARGVELVDGTLINAEWVVLAAGVFGSPSMLMRSGIGPSAHLSALDIPILVDLPGVGANLGDHPSFELEFEYTGEARETPVFHSIATFHSHMTSSDEPPDLMLWVADPVASPGEPAAFSIEVVLLRPKSRGTVLLGSADPMDQPRVHRPNLVEEVDVDRLAEGYGVALEVANRPELRDVCRPLGPEATDSQAIRQAIRSDTYSVPHFVGTCSMGPAGNSAAVVDTFGRVHGTERLSVIDASIMPTVPSGFTHISTIMIAERLAERVGASL